MRGFIGIIRILCVAACLGLFSSAYGAQLISTLSSTANTSSLMAGDQSNTELYDWATASQLHVSEYDIVVNGITVIFDFTNNDTSQFLEIGIFESTGTHGTDLAPGELIGSFNTSTIPASDTSFSIYLDTISEFVLHRNMDYLLVWNAQPGAPYLGLKSTGLKDDMINDGNAGFFTGNKARSIDGGLLWSSALQYGFDRVSIDGDISSAPLPAAVWCFGSGLLALIGISSRKKAA